MIIHSSQPGSLVEDYVYMYIFGSLAMLEKEQEGAL